MKRETFYGPGLDEQFPRFNAEREAILNAIQRVQTARTGCDFGTESDYIKGKNQNNPKFFNKMTNYSDKITLLGDDGAENRDYILATHKQFIAFPSYILPGVLRAPFLR